MTPTRFPERSTLLFHLAAGSEHEMSTFGKKFIEVELTVKLVALETVEPLHTHRLVEWSREPTDRGDKDVAHDLSDSIGQRQSRRLLKRQFSQ